MKTKVLLMLVAAEISALSQGSVQFVNKLPSANLDVPIYYAPGGPASGKPDGTNAIRYGSQLFGGIYARAALYGGPAGTSQDGLVQVGPAASFRTGTTAGYLVSTNALRILTNVPVGGAAVFQVRAWDCGYEVNSWAEVEQCTQRRYSGESMLVNVVLGDTNAPAALVGLTAFEIGYPLVVNAWPPVLSIKPTLTNTVVVSPWCCGTYDSSVDMYLQVQTNLLGAGIHNNWSELPGVFSEYVVPINPNIGSMFYRVQLRQKPGMVLFNNKVSSAGVDAPVSYNGGGPVPAGRIDGSTAIPACGMTFGGLYARAALYGGPAGTAESALILMGPAVGFRSGAAAGYINPGTNSMRAVPGVSYMSPAVVQLRVWDCGCEADSFEDASTIIYANACGYLGVSALLNVPTLGTITNPAPLVGLPGFFLGP